LRVVPLPLGERERGKKLPPLLREKGVGVGGTERYTERVEGLLGCFTSGLNTQSEALSTYPCHLQTSQTLILFPACPHRAGAANLDRELKGCGQRSQWAWLSTAAIPSSV